MTVQSAVEALEARSLLSVAVVHGVAVITGTDGDDDIRFSLYTSWEQTLYKVRINRVTQPSPWRLGGTFDRFVIDAGRGNDDVRVIQSTFRVDVYGRAGDDRIDFNAWGLVRAGGGDDVVDASGSADVTLHGGAGDDFLRGGDNSYRDDTEYDGELYGGDGRDTLLGGARRDLLEGGAGDDLLRGRRGDDVLVGGAGSDRFFGGGDHNTLFVSKKEPHDGGEGDEVLFA